MAGKLTDDRMMSASRLPALMGFSKYSTRNDELQFSIDAISGAERPDIGNEAMAWGNTLEPVILAEAAQRLGLTSVDTNITEPYRHKKLPLQCSLDGIGTASGQVITTDPAKGIYVVGQDSITLDGVGVLEAKLTKMIPEEAPDLARGPIQLQGQMMCTGYKWGAVCVLYQGIELRVFLFAPHEKTQAAIANAVEDFEAKLCVYREQGIVDWYPPDSSKDADRIYPNAEDKVVDLEESAEDLARLILECKSDIRLAEKEIERAETALKLMLGDASKARAGRYQIGWPMRNFKAQPEKVIAAKEAYSIRQSTLNIKEIAA